MTRALPVVEAERTCGACQACCFAIAVYPEGRTEKALTPAFERCRHQSADGCDVYAVRPKPCADFKCMWLLGWASGRDRPDRLGLIFEAHVDYPDAVAITEVFRGARHTKHAQKRIDQVCSQVTLAVLYPFGGGEPILIAPTEEMTAAWEEYLKTRDALKGVTAEEPKYTRAGSETICATCSEPYWKHPHDPHVLGFEGKPFLRVLCDTTRVKL